MPPRKNMHRPLTNPPLAYFITLRTYGTWLHGDPRTSVTKTKNTYNTPRIAPNPTRLSSAQNRMHEPPTILSAEGAHLIEQTITEVCTHRNWKLHALHARTNHIHIIVTAPVTPERVMNDFKAWGTRKLRQHNYIGPSESAWADHGSTPYLWSEAQLLAAIDYVNNWQGGPLQKSWEQVRTEIDEGAQTAK